MNVIKNLTEFQRAFFEWFGHGRLELCVTSFKQIIQNRKFSSKFRIYASQLNCKNIDNTSLFLSFNIFFICYT